ncbi:MAG TPA: rhamnogalacturonan acetylesterase [Steroidobacteraceae bacterium]|nr:rhamnogalacturonan acetylesterase [Steroidobacteraceae bacterium]
MGRKVESRGWVALLLLLAVGAKADEPMHFDFGKGGNAAGHPAYDPARGFGFEATATGQPERFSIRTPEGNYRVTVEASRSRGTALAMIHAEQRRLMRTDTTRGRGRTVSFVVNVRTPDLPALPENATGGTRVALKPREIGSPTWDDRLTLQIAPDFRGISTIRIERTTVPTLYLAGDSTVTDQPVAPNASWGQFVTRYFDDGIAVANHAESGESLKSFVTEHRFDKLLSNLNAGDWVMIQFGHNDQKTQWPQTYADAATTYRSWLRTYIAEIRRRGATPLLVTSPERRNFDTDGHIRPTLAEYATAMRAVASEEKVALLDLNAVSIRFYEALGPALAARAFAEGGDDKTHHNEYGAQQLARCVIEALKAANTALTAGLEKHIARDAGTFDVTHPPLPN